MSFAFRLCVSQRVGVTRACGLDSLQLVLGVIPRGVSPMGFFYPIVGTI